MKIQIAKYLSLFIILSLTTIVSCKKDEQINKSSNTKPLARTFTDTSSLTEIFSYSYNLHNSFLENEYDSLTYGSLKFNDLNGFRTMDSIFFLNEYSSEAMGQVNDSAFSLYSKTDYNEIMLSVISNDENVNETYLWIDSTIKQEVSSDEFNDLALARLAEINGNPELSTSTKQTLATILGVSSGSYSYWNTNLDKWHTTLTNQGSTSAARSKVYDLVIADCRGCSWGGLIGSFVPAVGNVAGGVIWGAIFSGLEAASWD